MRRFNLLLSPSSSMSSALPRPALTLLCKIFPTGFLAAVGLLVLVGTFALAPRSAAAQKPAEEAAHLDLRGQRPTKVSPEEKLRTTKFPGQQFSNRFGFAKYQELFAKATGQQNGSVPLMRAAADLSGEEPSVADVDGDGNLDVLTIEDTGGTPTTTLYLGDSQGGFVEAGADLTDFSRGTTAIADVNGDQNPDLLLTGTNEFGDPSTLLYLGDGQGGFSEAGADLTETEYGASVSIADVNGDGNPDVLITGFNGQQQPVKRASLHLGDGEGGFTIANAGLNGVYRGSTSIADVDGDGNQDLLITGDFTTTLYLGDGQGGFTEANAGLIGVQDGSTSIADVNSDGSQDLLITGQDPNINPAATLYLGDGQGGFSEANAGLMPTRGGTAIKDVDGDGNQDLLITGDNVDSVPTATLYLGDGQGGFTEANAGLTGVSHGSAAIADFYGDGDQDLLISGGGQLFEGFPRLYVNRSSQVPPNQSPLFTQTASYDRTLAPGLTLRHAIEAGDPDGDSISIQVASGPSAVTVDDAGNGTAMVAVSPTRNQGGNSFDSYIEVRDPAGESQSFWLPIEVSPVVAALSPDLRDLTAGSASITDLNGDGNADLLVTGRDSSDVPTTTLYSGDGQGGFVESNAGLTGTEIGSASIADLNKDENKDVLVTGRDSSGAPSTKLYLGNGQGGFTEVSDDLVDVFSSSTSIADVNSDGHQDLLITGTSGTSPIAKLYLGDGQAGFTEAGAGLTGIQSASTSIADVNGDGDKDLLITGQNANGEPTTTLYLGDGQGGFAKANANLTDVQFGSTIIADLNEDGNQDLLINGWDASSHPIATVYLGDGQGNFTETDAGFSGTVAGATSVADFDGDENEDVLITGGDSDLQPSATLYLGDGQGGFSRANAGLAGVFQSASAVGDIDGDQDPDLLTTGISSTTGTRSTLLYENLFDDPLPVELAGFEATVDGNEVRLTWQTASETRNARFEVERRADEQSSWTRVGSVEGAGTTTEAQSYRFKDGNLPYEAENLNYRLKQVDTNGSATYSKEVTVERAVQKVELLAMYPNPARSRAMVRYAVPEKQKVRLRLYDVLGRRVRTVVSGNQEGRQMQRVDLSSLSSGVYFLRLQAGGQRRTQRLTVVN